MSLWKRAANAPMPTTPAAAEVERLERVMRAAFAAWEAVEGPAAEKPSREEIDRAWDFRRALDAYTACTAAMERLREREQGEGVHEEGQP